MTFSNLVFVVILETFFFSADSRRPR